MEHANIRVINPNRLPHELSCRRARLGNPGDDFKPVVTKMSDGTLFLVNCHSHSEEFLGYNCMLHCMIHRSDDNGETWTSRHSFDTYGKEPYITAVNDILFITVHLYCHDVQNVYNKCVAYLYRSEDRGVTWQQILVDPGQDGYESSSPLTRRAESEDGSYAGNHALTTRNMVRLDDGTLVMFCVYRGEGCFKMTSRDDGRTWSYEPVQVRGQPEVYSLFEEGFLWVTDSGRLICLDRCHPDKMEFSTDIPGLRYHAVAGSGNYDQLATELLYESRDLGMTWEPIGAVPTPGVMYPSVLRLGNNEYLLTFTVRVALEGNHMGVKAVFMKELPDGSITIQCDRDFIAIGERTPDCLATGGGFGNTIRTDDGMMLTPYSYRDADEDVKDDIVNKRYDDREHYTRLHSLVRNWKEYAAYDFDRFQQECDPSKKWFYVAMNECLKKSRHVIEIAKWKLPQLASYVE